MKKVSKHNFKFDKDFAYKTDELLSTSDDLIKAVNDWTKQTKTRTIFCIKRKFMREKWLQFAFKTEEDFSMFTLRWGSVFEEEFQNSMHLNFVRLAEIIGQRANRIIDINEAKDDEDEE